MNNPTILKRIRKLLRLSKSKGPEGERAAERARELMERHGLSDVDVDDRVRLIIQGVDGEFWREQVLIAVAQAAGVQLLQAERAGKPVAALQGERQDVEAAGLAYRRVTLEMTRRCWAAFRQVAFGRHPIIEGVWCRIFHIGAASSLGESITEALAKARAERKQNPRPGQPTIDEVPPTPEERKAVEEPTEDPMAKKQRLERERSERELLELARLIGADAAVSFQDQAFHNGVAHGKQIPLREAPLLPRNGHKRVKGWVKMLCPDGSVGRRIYNTVEME
jgi:hypothetical protein